MIVADEVIFLQYILMLMAYNFLRRFMVSKLNIYKYIPFFFLYFILF